MLDYNNFNNEFFIVECDKNKYNDFFEPLDCKIHKNGFLIPKLKNLQMKKIIDYINEEEKKNKYKNPDPKTYYQSFNSRPNDFMKIMNKDDDKEDDDEDDDDYDEEYSSSSYNTSSTDNFPSPSTPGRQYTSTEIEEIFEYIKDLQKRVRILEQKK